MLQCLLSKIRRRCGKEVFYERCKNKRKLAVLGLAAAMALSLAACGEKRPSQEDVEQSIEAGTLTIEDALDKGWVDQAWVDAYYEENSVPAASKTESNMVGDFATTTPVRRGVYPGTAWGCGVLCLPGSGSGGDAGLL